MDGSSWTLDAVSGSRLAAAAVAAGDDDDDDLSDDLVSAERIDARRRLSYNNKPCSRLSTNDTVLTILVCADWLID